ncbi:MAG: phage SPO1 DNA polymerase-related protein [Parcubacteria group bacterium GW2011_GWB1_46_8]|nr:MAG: phage SPO1 DNA polymerase-related protein [Parcubacteria group bacterium GW2011_GWF1_45_5]KKU11299.1 MAG: phage SPO1 DNA polymerase-related protein [Parcubacteria group bacterium GW2011_GWA1_45_7]KKU43918.1 MAG: phage SPO1 DNA polymerase-related protein [Parcubacteria group bacterium GW2011_GWA2_46_7]KKU45913.1 MAG: phage SPO1 DNA polymerase-related protein [Parcubacteria group bacterium GW2011_GWB1_46_8]
MMTKTLQLKKLHAEADRLHKQFGSKRLLAVHGAGCVNQPQAMFIFINPTGKNISAYPAWKGMRAQWLGTKQIWKLFYQLGFLSRDTFAKTQALKPHEWTPAFCISLYAELAKHKIYITNFAKSTQQTARPMKKQILQRHLESLLAEVYLISPKTIVTFGNETSSLLLQKPISVSSYTGKRKETLLIKNKRFPVYPAYYPVGQGMRNLPKAIKRIKVIL